MARAKELATIIDHAVDQRERKDAIVELEAIRIRDRGRLRGVG